MVCVLFGKTRTLVLAGIKALLYGLQNWGGGRLLGARFFPNLIFSHQGVLLAVPVSPFLLVQPRTLGERP